jgi:CRP-like cAMP-binding protein
MRPTVAAPGTYLALQGSASDALFFLQHGTVDVTHLGHTVTTIVAPACFGEAALIKGEVAEVQTSQSGYRVRSTSKCAMLSFRSPEML